MNPSVNLGILRHVLTFIGGLLVAKGMTDAAQVGQLVSDMITAIGAVISIVGVVGSILQKVRQKRELDAARAVPATLPFSMEGPKN